MTLSSLLRCHPRQGGRGPHSTLPGALLALLLACLPAMAGAASPAGTWVNITPSNANLDSTYGGDNYGTQSICVDPRRPANLYAHFNNQGIWKSTNYGESWTGPINTGTNGVNSNGAGGFTIADGGAGNPPILYLSNIRGGTGVPGKTFDGTGFWRSLDGGVNWTRYPVNVAELNGRRDCGGAVVDPYDPHHLLVTWHELDVLVESFDGGQTWANVPLTNGMKVGGGSSVLTFIDTGNPATTRTSWLYMVQMTGGNYGTWRTTDGGARWYKVDNNEHPHGTSQFYQPGNGVFYMAGIYSANGWGVQRSTNFGLTWEHVGSTAGEAVVFGTSNYVYTGWSWAQGPGNINPNMQRAAQPGSGAWSSFATPPEMFQGPAHAVVTNDGTNNIIVTANWLAGLWRYVEPAQSGGNPVVISLSPSAPVVAVGGSQQFTAPVLNATNPAVTWSVPEGSAGGTINATGFYAAPATAGVYHVKATSVADPTKSATVPVLITKPAGANTTALRPTPMPVISFNRPVYVSGTAQYVSPTAANDANPASMWVSNSIPAWIAYDLSGVSLSQRQQVFITWYANWALGYINESAGPDLHIPIDYTIEINSAAGGGSSAPTTGWQQVVSVTGNNRGTRQHLVNLAGANWVRLRATTSSNPTDIAIDFDVHAAPSGASDSWMFMGDSITGNTAYIFSEIPTLVNGFAPDRWPAIVPAAKGGNNTGTANDWFDDTISLFPGRYVVLAFGTNDGPGLRIEELVQKVIAVGKVPVVPHMPWSNIPDQLAKAPLINAEIDALYLKYPAILPGPDLYAAFFGRTDLIPSMDVHPNDPGSHELRRQWALTMAAAGTAPTTPNPPAGSARADFNADGKPDLVWSNSLTGERALWLMNGTNFLSASTLGLFPLEWTVAATGDFNADGKPDVVWSNSITGERALWLMNGTNLLGVSTLGVFPLEWTVAATGDFNADAKPDLVWSNSITGERALWLMNGTNLLGVSTLGVFPLEWTVAGTADFNADGKTDLIWSNSVTGERALWLMDGTNFLAASTLGIFPLEWTVKN